MQHPVHRPVSSYTEIDSPCNVRFGGFSALVPAPSRLLLLFAERHTPQLFFWAPAIALGPSASQSRPLPAAIRQLSFSLGSDKDGDDDRLSRISRAVDKHPPLRQRRLRICCSPRPHHSPIHCWAVTEPPKPPG